MPLTQDTWDHILPPSSGCSMQQLCEKLPDSWIGKNKKTQPTSCIKWITKVHVKKGKKIATINQLLLFFILIRNTEQIGDLTFPHTGFQCFHEVGRWHLGTGYEKKKTLKIHISLCNDISGLCSIRQQLEVKPLSCLWIQSQNRKPRRTVAKYPSSLRNRNDTLKKYLLILHKLQIVNT